LSLSFAGDPRSAAKAGWGGRIRTFEYGIQSPAPYQLGHAPEDFTPDRVLGRH
jgi:hypothetical protein